MKKTVLDRLATLKEKSIKLQMKLGNIESKCAYANAEKFKFFKVEIEDALVGLEETITSVEVEVERMEQLAEMKWFKETENDFTFYVEEEIKAGTKQVKKKINQISDLFNLAVN